MKATYTPGPWELRDKSGVSWGQEQVKYEIGGSNNRVVAVVMFGDFTPQSASAEISRRDARLISAAPELLEALEQVFMWADNPPIEIFQKAEAAIRKAKGGD